jgi:hypothetical protein
MSEPRSTALLTGASAGIGRDLAFVLAENGHDLLITARDETRLRQLADDLQGRFGVRVEVIPKDLAKPESPQEIFDEISAKQIQIDLLINNAGFGAGGRFDQIPLEKMLQMLQVNVTALTHLTRLFLPAMIQRGSGRVMNVASTAAFVSGPLMAEYYASKAYVLSLSEAIAFELKRTGVTITALCPGPTSTEFQKRAGLEHSALFKHAGMDSMTVARIGYRAMMSGKRIAITGMTNKILTNLNRFMPRALIVSVVKKLNQNR